MSAVYEKLWQRITAKLDLIEFKTPPTHEELILRKQAEELIGKD